MNSKQTDLCCLLGYAGTGKTTFLRYLQYIHINDNNINNEKSLANIASINNTFKRLFGMSFPKKVKQFFAPSIITKYFPYCNNYANFYSQYITRQ